MIFKPLIISVPRYLLLTFKLLIIIPIAIGIASSRHFDWFEDGSTNAHQPKLTNLLSASPCVRKKLTDYWKNPQRSTIIGEIAIEDLFT